jgi:UDPglucose--hexose-1-phosphate uridylyltransferase
MQIEQGCSRVICFSPDHSKTLPELSLEELEAHNRQWWSCRRHWLCGIQHFH